MPRPKRKQNVVIDWTPAEAGAIENVDAINVHNGCNEQESNMKEPSRRRQRPRGVEADVTYEATVDAMPVKRLKKVSGVDDTIDSSLGDQRFPTHLENAATVDSCATAAVETCAPLSEPLARLVRLYKALDSTCSLIKPRGVVCTFDQVAPSVQSMAGCSLEMIDIQRMITVSPSTISLKWVHVPETDSAGACTAFNGEYLLEIVLKHIRAGGYFGQPKAVTPKQVERRCRQFERAAVELCGCASSDFDLNAAVGGAADRDNIAIPPAEIPPYPLDEASDDICLLAAMQAEAEHAMAVAESYAPEPVQSVEAFLERLQQSKLYRGQIVHIERVPARTARYGEVSASCALARPVVAALDAVGIKQLFCHQARAIEGFLSGKNVVVATPTSSGKSLAFVAPILDAIMRDPSTVAVLLFPTKALAQDQLRSLRRYVEADATLSALVFPATYDGDCGDAERLRVRETANVILTNPDMLHASILPQHARWPRFFERLKIVVLDEAHAYSGVFGSHVGCVLRRLLRLCHECYGSRPRFVACSATIGNPTEHFRRLIGPQPPGLPGEPGGDVLEIGPGDDGSPSGVKHFVLWNPPLLSEAAVKAARAKAAKLSGQYQHIETAVTTRLSPIMEAARLMSHMIAHGFRTICFCRYRKVCELTLERTHTCLTDIGRQELCPLVMSYRGGYTAEDRRRIERDLFSDRLLGVVATTALELGVDIGSLDASIQVGFPGSAASLWQQAGRAGRGEKDSLSVVVCYDGPLDQYFVRNPRYMFQMVPEQASIDPENAHVLWFHLLCAACEMPLCAATSNKSNSVRGGGAGALYLGDNVRFGNDAFERVVAAMCAGVQAGGSRNPGGAALEKRGNSWYQTYLHGRPTQEGCLRSIDNESYKVIDESKGRVLDEIDRFKAFFAVYDGAIYSHQGDRYIVRKLSLSERVAYVRPCSVSYYTSTRDHTDVTTLRVIAGRRWGAAAAHYSKATVCTSVWGYRRICERSGDVLDTIELSLPPMDYDTYAAWIDISAATKRAVESSPLGLNFKAGVHGAAHAVVALLPLFLMCDPHDVGCECINPFEQRGRPLRILVYDRHAGGTGLSQQAYPFFADLVRMALELIEGCPCGGLGGLESGRSVLASAPMLASAPHLPTTITGAVDDTANAVSGVAAEGNTVLRNSGDSAGASSGVDVARDPLDDKGGCIACVFHGNCTEYNAVVDKRAAVLVLRHTLAEMSL